MWIDLHLTAQVPPRNPKAGSKLPLKGKLITKPVTLRSFGTISLALRPPANELTWFRTGCTACAQGSLDPRCRPTRSFSQSVEVEMLSSKISMLSISENQYQLRHDRMSIFDPRIVQIRSIGGRNMPMHASWRMSQRAFIATRRRASTYLAGVPKCQTFHRFWFSSERDPIPSWH